MKGKRTLMMKQMKLRIKFFVDLSTVWTENRGTCGFSFAALDILRPVNISVTKQR